MYAGNALTGSWRGAREGGGGGEPQLPVGTNDVVTRIHSDVSYFLETYFEARDKLFEQKNRNTFLPKKS